MRAVAPLCALALACGQPEVGDRRAQCLQRNAGAPPRYARIVQAFCAEHHNLEGIGASLAIAEDGELRLVATAGESCLGGQAVRESTRFRVGSVTKLLTAALTLQVADAGLLDLDAPLPELATWTDPRAATITWRQLLSHTAGVADPPPLELGANWLQILGARPLWRAPGALWSYSSDGYAVVGAGLERRTQQDYGALLSARLLAPLGLAGVTVDPHRAVTTGAACGHLGRGAGATAYSVAQDLAIGTGDARWALPAGGAIASATELVTLALALVDPGRSPLSPGSRAALLTAEVPTHERPGERYGLGLRLNKMSDGTLLFGHSGNTGDFAADLYFAPDKKFAVALLANSGDHLRVTAATVLQELLSVALERAEPMAAPGRYVGTYAGPGASVTISAHAGSLRISGPGLAGVALEHAGDHRFRVAGRPELGGLTFVFAAGAARASDLRSRPFVGARVEDDRPR